MLIKFKYLNLGTPIKKFFKVCEDTVPCLCQTVTFVTKITISFFGHLFQGIISNNTHKSNYPQGRIKSQYLVIYGLGNYSN